MSAVIRVDVDEKLYLRDPADTEVGRNIISGSLKLIDSKGFDAFTFRKLAEAIRSTEATVYRYFESKHHLMQYLVSWYWGWLEYLVDVRIRGMKRPEEKLQALCEILAAARQDDPLTDFVDEAQLHRVVVTESMDSYARAVRDRKKRKSAIAAYERLAEKAASIFLEVHPNYARPKSLFVTLTAACFRLLFFADSFPGVVEFKKGKRTEDEVAEYLLELAQKTLVRPN